MLCKLPFLFLMSAKAFRELIGISLSKAVNCSQQPRVKYNVLDMDRKTDCQYSFIGFYWSDRQPVHGANHICESSPTHFFSFQYRLTTVNMSTTRLGHLLVLLLCLLFPFLFPLLFLFFFSSSSSSLPPSIVLQYISIWFSHGPARSNNRNCKSWYRMLIH